MIATKDYTARFEALRMMTEEQALSPTMPVEVFIQEAEELYEWCQPDRDLLTGVGIDWMMVEDMQVRIGVCREAQSIWNRERFLHEAAQRDWNEQAPEAYKLRDTLLDAMRYAYRKDDNLLGRVAAITDGRGHADMIQDLSDISALGRENTTLLQRINFDLMQLERATHTSDAMADLLAKSTADQKSKSANRLLRDKAYTHLKEAVDEIRDAGKYALADQSERLKGYISDYYRKQNNRRPDKAAEPETEMADV